MNERGIEVKVGILITVCLALLVTFIVLLGDFSLSEGGELYVDVETSADLKPGAPVKIAGTPAGKVREVTYKGGQFDEAVGRRVWVRVGLEVHTDKLPTIRKNASLYITTQGVLGEKYVEIDPGSPEAEAVKPGDILVGEPPLRLEVMAMNASRVLSTLDRILRENEGEIGSILKNVNGTVKTARGTVERIDKTIAAAEPKVQRALDELLRVEESAQSLLAGANTAIGDGTAIRRTIGNVESISRDVRGEVKPVVREVKATLQKFGDVADSGKIALGDARGMVDGALKKVNGILDDVKQVAENVKNGRGTIGALLSDKEMYDDIREMMKDLKRHPWKFLWKE